MTAPNSDFNTDHSRMLNMVQAMRRNIERIQTEALEYRIKTRAEIRALKKELGR